jgi:hypothetical protein
MSDSNNCRPRAPALLTPVDPPRSCVLGFILCCLASRYGRFMEYSSSLVDFCSAVAQAPPTAVHRLNRPYCLPLPHPFRPQGQTPPLDRLRRAAKDPLKKAKDLLETIQQHEGTALPGYIGGEAFSGCRMNRHRTRDWQGLLYPRPLPNIHAVE